MASRARQRREGAGRFPDRFFDGCREDGLCFGLAGMSKLGNIMCHGGEAINGSLL